MKELSIGLAGVGEIAQNFHLPAYQKMKNVKLVAIYDRVKSKAEILAEKFNVPYVCDNFEELLSIEKLDAVDICASTDAHHQLAIQSINAGKHTLIEKPIARNYYEAKEINDAAIANPDVKVMIGHSQRFRFDAKLIKQLVQLKELGEVFYINASWLQKKRGAEWRNDIERSGGGVLIDLGVSLIDSLLWIIDYEPVKSVCATVFKHVTTNAEDICIANIKFKNGSIATMEMSWSLFTQHTNFSFNVYGSKGGVKINPVQIFKNNGEIDNPVANNANMTNISIHRKSFEGELKHFVNSVLGLVPVVSTPSEAVKVMKVIELLYKSAEIGKEIDFDENY